MENNKGFFVTNLYVLQKRLVFAFFVDLALLVVCGIYVHQWGAMAFIYKEIISCFLFLLVGMSLFENGIKIAKSHHLEEQAWKSFAKVIGLLSVYETIYCVAGRWIAAHGGYQAGLAEGIRRFVHADLLGDGIVMDSIGTCSLIVEFLCLGMMIEALIEKMGYVRFTLIMFGISFVLQMLNNYYYAQLGNPLYVLFLPFARLVSQFWGSVLLNCVIALLAFIVSRKMGGLKHEEMEA